MNWDTAEGNCKQSRGKVTAQCGRPTCAHLDVIDGKRVELSGKMQGGHGTTKDAVEQQIERFEWRHTDQRSMSQR